jgi:hypothetical protein
LRNLLELSVKVPWKEPARVLFASSISTALATPRNLDGTTALVAERAVPSLSHCLATGYAQSKLVCEKVCEQAAAAGATVVVLRIGQFVGDVEKGIWNPKEAIPLMVQSALAIGALPVLDGETDLCEWMPIDSMAEACLQTDQHGVFKASDNGKGDNTVTSDHCSSRISFYNLVSRHSHSWNSDVLPAPKQAGLRFEIVPFSAWIAKVKSFVATNGTVSEKGLPALKLVDYYEELYGGVARGSSIARFDLTEGIRSIPALRTCPSVVSSGLVAKSLGVWMEQWVH